MSEWAGLSEDEARLQLWDRYWSRCGFPRRVRDDVAGVVLVFAAGSRESAEASAAANREVWGHPARAELREAVGWVSVVDLRPALGAAVGCAP